MHYIRKVKSCRGLLFPRRYTNGQQLCEKVLSIPDYQGKASENRSETSYLQGAGLGTFQNHVLFFSWPWVAQGISKHIS